MAHIHFDGVGLALPGCPIDRPLSFGALFRRWRAESRPALRDVSFTAADGDRVALVGCEIARHALLRLLAGQEQPEAGKLIVEGEVLYLAEGSYPLDLEATGWENIERQHGWGQTGRGLAEFCDLGEFLDLPVRYYSDGMRWRLGFTLATAREAEVLLVEEGFGGGDLAFRLRAEKRLRRLIDRARIAIVSSCDLTVLAEVCERAVWLEEGRLRDQGRAENVLAAYRSRRGSLAA